MDRVTDTAERTAPSSSERAKGTPPPGTARRRLLADRLARAFVSVGGLAIIASILGILVFIWIEVQPLLAGARVAVSREISVPGTSTGAMACDAYRTHIVTLDRDGVSRVIRVSDGRVLSQKALLPPPRSPVEPGLVEAWTAPGSVLTASTRDGRIVLTPTRFDVDFQDSERQVFASVGDAVVLDVDPSGKAIETYAAQLSADGTAVAAAQLADGSLAVVRRGFAGNEFTSEKSEASVRHVVAPPFRVTRLLLDRDQLNLYGGTADGRLVWWRLTEGAPAAPQLVSAGPSPITALNLLVGDRALVVGQQSGALSVWFRVRQPDQSFRLTRIRDFPSHPGAIRLIEPSQRDKGFLAQDETGRLGLYHSTSHRVLFTGASPIPSATALLYAPKADGAFLAGGDRIVSLDVENPHPETSLGSLFGKVWYEGADKPEYVWQSGGSSDEVEPKLSLVPLLFGTLKGTLYSLILAIPLGVLAAMYTSQFMHPSLKRYVKPAVEIMAALPSVVLGFLAGLWLAPRVERAFPALLLMAVILPPLVIVAGFVWNRLPLRFRGRFPTGAEVAFFMVALAAGVWLCVALATPVEALLFGGSFPSWLLESTGLRYDQKNAVIVGLAMGFAVIPIIFAISEDAFSNVPRNLVSGSLALGASRWQTVMRVVLPTASPGIFSAIMIGFGRAIGETMIVVMATGNTAIMNWSPFDGFRTLSANVATEIPEAARGGTLYRTLFLAALLLFVFTFLINTAADLVRQRLRRRYAEL